MIVELNHEDFVHLVLGTTPSLDKVNHPLIKDRGSVTGGMSISWEWKRYKLEELTEEELYTLYKLCTSK